MGSVLRQLRRLADSDELQLQFPVDVRFVRRSDNCLLSPHSFFDAVYFNVLVWRSVSPLISSIHSSCGAEMQWAGSLVAMPTVGLVGRKNQSSYQS